MKVLGIETSSTLGGFAVIDDNRLLAELISDITGRHVEKGAAMIEEVLGHAGVAFKDLDGVAVSLGPGSFTGLRVGLAIAKGICFGRQIDLVGVPTLDCIAESLSCWKGTIVPMRDARRGEIYFSTFAAEGCSVARTGDYLASPPERVVDEIKKIPARQSILLAGDALDRYGEFLRSELASKVVFAPQMMWIARPSLVALMGSSLLREGSPADLDTIEPMYIRLSEAERKALKPVDDGTAQDKTDG